MRGYRIRDHLVWLTIQSDEPPCIIPRAEPGRWPILAPPKTDRVCMIVPDSAEEFRHLLCIDGLWFHGVPEAALELCQPVDKETTAQAVAEIEQWQRQFWT